MMTFPSVAEAVAYLKGRPRGQIVQMSTLLSLQSASHIRLVFLAGVAVLAEGT